MSTFTGFSEEDLKRIKSGETDTKSADLNSNNIKRPTKIGTKPQKPAYKYKTPIIQNQNLDDAIDSIQFDKCKLSIRSTTSPSNDVNIMNIENNPNEINEYRESTDIEINMKVESLSSTPIDNVSRKSSSDIAPDIVRGVENYTEDELATHVAKLEELQLKQKIMEEQNKKRKEMLAKALADRTKQTAEEVMKLEKIKKELQVLDGQFSQDVSVLRKKIDQACLSYADAEKHYLKVEKEFLQAKINLQKEREKKELLTEHLCALITHNETRKAQKLETLMLELAADKKCDIKTDVNDINISVDNQIVDGVDQRTGKIVELPAAN